MPTRRIKRPKLERTRPKRTWSTLFGSSAGSRPSASTEDEGGQAARSESRANSQKLSEAVDTGYRVIEDYLSQGQKVAQSFAPSFRGASATSGDQPAEMAQRVMQYGWDFFGLWFEMASKMASGAPGFPPPGAPVTTPRSESARPNAADSKSTASPGSGDAASGAENAVHVIVAVSSQRATTTALDVRPGNGPLVIHALRPEGHDGPPIRDIDIHWDAQGGSVTLKVAVKDEHPAGVYNAMIVDAGTNLPRGTLSLEILPSGKT